jgi:hypothetical protein
LEIKLDRIDFLKKNDLLLADTNPNKKRQLAILDAEKSVDYSNEDLVSAIIEQLCERTGEDFSEGLGEYNMAVLLAFRYDAMPDDNVLDKCAEYLRQDREKFKQYEQNVENKVGELITTGGLNLNRDMHPLKSMMIPAVNKISNLCVAEEMEQPDAKSGESSAPAYKK